MFWLEYFFRAKDPADYYAAGRKISKVGSGMAIASNWMSAASVLGMAGMMYGFGYNGLAYVVGWTGGYVLLVDPYGCTDTEIREIHCT